MQDSPRYGDQCVRYYEWPIVNTSQNTDESIAHVADAFVSARKKGQALNAYPGTLPASLNQAYACQDLAIRQWADQIGGWKVGLIGKAFQKQFESARLVGPIFQSLIQASVKCGVNECPIFAGGFAAVEGEIVFKLADNAPNDKYEWSNVEALDLVATAHAGIEIASSPLSTINDLGPAVTASDFGNNFGLIVGPEITGWKTRSLDEIACQTLIEGVTVGQKSASSIPGGPVASLVFALSICARRGYPLRAGQYICTGAITGVHTIVERQQACVRFTDIGDISCRVVAATAVIK